MKKVSSQLPKMEAGIAKPEMTLGLDLGDRYSHYCLLNGDGAVIEEGRLQSTEAALRRHFERSPVWMFSWQHILPNGQRARKKRQVGSLDQYKTEVAAERACEAGDWPSTPIRYTHSVESR